MILYHGTHQKFVTIDFEIKNRADGHANGCLGLWVSPDLDLAKRFGPHILKVTLSNPTVIDIWVGELAAMSRLSPEDNSKIRELYVAQGKSLIEIIERDGTSPTRVILSGDHVIDTEWLS